MTDNTTTIEATPATPADPATPPAATPAPPAQVLGNWETQVPEKFKKDGQINYEALAKSYVHLEKMKPIKAPESPDGYAWKAPEGIEVSLEDLKPFAEGAHKLGFSPEQYTYVMDELAGTISALSDEIKSEAFGSHETTTAALKQEFGDKYDAQIALAEKAWEKFGDGLDGFENHPGIIKLMAKLGAQLGSDPGINSPGAPAQQTLDALMSHPAYTNPFHAEHAQIKAQVDAAFAAGGRPSFLRR